MKNAIILPVIAGNVCVIEKKAILATINTQGNINLQTKELKTSIIPHNIPFLRGIEFFFLGLFYFLYFMVSTYEYGNKDVSTKVKWLKVLNSVLFILIGIGFFIFVVGYLPNAISLLICNQTNSLFIMSLCIAFFRVVFIYGLILIVFNIPSLKNFTKFNGAIYNKGKEECFPNFLIFLVFALLLDYFVLSLISFYIPTSFLHVFKLFILCVIAGGVFEFLYWIKDKKLNVFLLPLSLVLAPKPSKTELEIVNTVIYEGIFMEENKEREESCNNIPLSFVIAQTKTKLERNNIFDKDEELWLVASVLGKKKYDLKFISTITKEEDKRIKLATEKRCRGEPIAKIFGITHFYGLEFKVDKNVLTPRQETEILVEKVIKSIEGKRNILDLCTGSGAIAIAIAKHTDAKIIATDISEEALAVAKQNAISNGVDIEFKQSDLFSKLKRKNYYDIIVSNPPYIKTKDIDNLDTEVKNYDPVIALDGGEDGLYFYKQIAEFAPLYLKSNGKLFLEIGYDQAKKVKKLLTNGFKNIKIVKDLEKNDRIIIAEKK